MDSFVLKLAVLITVTFVVICITNYHVHTSVLDIERETETDSVFLAALKEEEEKARAKEQANQRNLNQSPRKNPDLWSHYDTIHSGIRPIYNHVECGGRGRDSDSNVNDNDNTNGNTNTAGGEPTIPRRLIFTYRNNMLETKEPRNLYENVRNTIHVYGNLWKQNASDVEVKFYDDWDCFDVIYTLDPRLIDPFLYEPYGAYAADICRVVALYCHGGYYFDVDIQAIRPLDPEPHIDFITAREGTGPGFFQAILAVSSMHPILNYTFDSMVNEWYYNPKVEDVVEDKTDSKFISTRIYKTVKGWFYDSGVKVKPLGKAITQMKFIPARIYTEDNLRKLTDTVEAAFMGPGTLKRGYERHYNNTQTSWLLKEIFNRDPVKYEALSRIKKNWLCDYLVHDEETSTPYFYSRILGIRSCPEKDAEIKDEVEKDTETKDEAEKDIETKDEVEKKEVKK
mmetsp:Transcript_23143/g.28395  ORF Transcript_23143/g.28395 Transcript_23143/m.28395 type:complete len:454 (-) Transcript_23143:2444-3805(-)